MIEVIPNWHPLFVHFPIALLSMATLFFIALHFVNNAEWQSQFKILAYWNLWLGTGFAVVTVIAGWFAYNSVVHDTPSHEAMTEHRNWALATLTIYLFAAAWAWRLYKTKNTTPSVFTLVMVLAFAMLASTGWHGSEAVYRYGLGVMSLPQAEGDGHAHEHAGSDHGSDHNSDHTLNKGTDHDTGHHESISTETQAADVNTATPAEEDKTRKHDNHNQHNHAH